MQEDDYAADGVQEEQDTWYGVRDVLSGRVVLGRYCGFVALWSCGLGGGQSGSSRLGPAN